VLMIDTSPLAVDGSFLFVEFGCVLVRTGLVVWAQPWAFGLPCVSAYEPREPGWQGQAVDLGGSPCEGQRAGVKADADLFGKRPYRTACQAVIPFGRISGRCVVQTGQGWFVAVVPYLLGASSPRRGGS
jgi:hypothetical protein